MQQLECDVLVIGGGLAGVWVALRAREIAPRVILAEKGKTGRAGQSPFSGANMLCPLSGDDLDAWQKEIASRGEYMSDQDWVAAVLSEQEARTRDMLDMGVEFERDGQGNLVRSVGLAHQVTRLSTVNSLQMMARFRKILPDRGVQLQDRFMATHLLTSDGCHPTRGRVAGALGFHTGSGEITAIAAGATVVATGGSGHFDLSGDGICQALMAGAEVTGMEFARCYDKMAFGKKWVEVHLNSFQRYGMTLRNQSGERFMERYDPALKERAQRQTLGLSILSEHLRGQGPVYMDLTHLDAASMEKLCDLPAVTRNIKLLAREGVDFRSGRVEINITSGFLRFLGGGIRHNLYCEASVPGLYAAGEAGGYPAHGTYSVGGMNLAECCVEGYRAGEYAGRFSREVDVRSDPDQVRRLSEEVLRPLQATKGRHPDEIWYGLQECVGPARVSVFRTSRSMKVLLARTRELMAEPVRAENIHDLVKVHKSRNYLLSAELIFTASLEREECRGCNIRADFPYRDDANWLKRVILTWDGNAIKTAHRPIPLYRYPARPEKYEKVPFPFPLPEPEESD
ncbi:MAG: FAD-binding protein [Chloroflexi bacterium]|nr:FAD-binding protein [Chloroflexota bacterium]